MKKYGTKHRVFGTLKTNRSGEIFPIIDAAEIIMYFVGLYTIAVTVVF